MRTIKDPLGFGYPGHKDCDMCGLYKATVCIQRFAPTARHQIGFLKSKNNVFYCVNCNMVGDHR